MLKINIKMEKESERATYWNRWVLLTAMTSTQLGESRLDLHERALVVGKIGQRNKQYCHHHRSDVEYAHSIPLEWSRHSLNHGGKPEPTI